MLQRAVQTTQVNGVELLCSLAPRMVVFSHGFGVRRDSRGMFTDLANSLPAGCGYVLFDYDHPQQDRVRASYATEQIERLRSVVAWAHTQPGVEKVGLIAHSRGCLIASMAQIHPLPMVIMLAPPLVQGHARQYFTNKPGVVREGDDWYVPRSDGTVTIIPEGVFEEFDNIQREAVLLEYASVQPMLAILAGEDAVLGKQDYRVLEENPNICAITVPGASHDFAGNARGQLINDVRSYVQEKL